MMPGPQLKDPFVERMWFLLLDILFFHNPWQYFFQTSELNTPFWDFDRNLPSGRYETKMAALKGIDPLDFSREGFSE